MTLKKLKTFGGGNYLSTLGVKKAERELLALQTERLNKWRTKYSATKRKLIKLLKDSHLDCGSVGFDPNEEVLVENYRQEERRLKQLIRGAKVVVKDRKQLMLRVELLRRAVKSRAPPEAIEAMHGKALDAAREIDGGSLSYDGKALEDALELLLREYRDASERDAPMLQQTETGASPPSMTRSGKEFHCK